MLYHAHETEVLQGRGKFSHLIAVITCYIYHEPDSEEIKIKLNLNKNSQLVGNHKSIPFPRICEGGNSR